MVALDDDMEFAKNLRIKKNQKKTDFEKMLNKNDLTSLEMDEMFNDDSETEIDYGGELADE